MVEKKEDHLRIHADFYFVLNFIIYLLIQKDNNYKKIEDYNK